MRHLPHKPILAVRRLAAPQQAEKPQGTCHSAGVRRCAPADNLVSAWHLERARKVNLICGCIARRMARGQTLESAVTYFVWAHAYSFYRCEPSRPFRLSRKTLVRLFYQWKNGGRTPQALTLRYRPARAKLSETKLARFVNACLQPAICSYAAAHKRTRVSQPGLSAFQKALPAPIRAAISKLFYQRRHVRFTKTKTLRVISRHWRAKA